MWPNDVFDKLDGNDVWSTAAAATVLAGKARQPPRDMMHYDTCGIYVVCG